MKRIFLAMTMCAAIAITLSPARAQHETSASGNAEHTARRVAEAGTPEGAHTPAAGEHEAEPPLLPSNAEQAKEYFLQPAVWTLIIFVIMLAILYPTAWKNVLAGLKAREQRIRKDIADAEAARGKAEATLREYNQQLATAEGRVREMLNKATADAERLATSIRMQAQQESEEIKERATKDIEAAKNQAIREIYAQASDIATTVASKIIKRNLNAADQESLVRESLDQLQTIR
jgi:F-type H+-transporting ATPase subunit b